MVVIVCYHNEKFLLKKCANNIVGAKMPDQRVGQPDGYDPYRGPPQQQPPMDNRDTHDPGRSKSVSNLNRPEHQFENRQHHSMATLPRMHQHQQQPNQGMMPGLHMGHGGPQQMTGPMDMNRHMSQPELSRRNDPDGPGHDYENYPGGPPHPGHPMDSRQADYVNQRDLRTQGPSQQLPGHGDPPEDRNNHSRVREWQQRNEMVNRQDGQFRPGQYNSLPRDPQKQQGRIQQPPGMGRPYDQHRPDQKPTNQPNFQGPTQPQQQGYPPTSQMNYPGAQQQQMSRANVGPYQGPHHSEQHATYQNVPPNQYPQNQKPPEMQDKMMRQNFPPNDRRNVSPDLPPPPDVPPELPPPPAEDLRNNSAEDLPPPPPQQQQNFDPRTQTDPRYMGPGQKGSQPYQGGQQPPHQNYQNYQNLPPTSSVLPYSGSGDSRGQFTQSPAQYTQSPTSHYPYQPRPAPAGAQQEMAPPPAKIATLGGSVSQLERDQHREHGHQSGPASKPPASSKPDMGQKRAPPIAAKPKINLAAEIKKSLASPWEREEKEREQRRKEEEMRMNRDAEIRDLESRNYLLPEEQERLKRSVIAI